MYLQWLHLRRLFSQVPVFRHELFFLYRYLMPAQSSWHWKVLHLQCQVRK